MKFKGFWYDSLIICIIAGVSAAFIAITAFVGQQHNLAIAECIAFLIICAVYVYRAVTAKKRYKRFILKTSKTLSRTLSSETGT